MRWSFAQLIWGVVVVAVCVVLLAYAAAILGMYALISAIRQW